MTDFSMTVEADGVAIVTWDVPGRSMNVMSFDGLRELETLIDRALADGTVKGIVIASGKKDSFAGGMDLEVLGRLRRDSGDNPAKRLFDGIMQTHRLFRKIELAGMDPKTKRGGKPIAAALPGTAMGIGLELPLATHRIFVADLPKAKIGLPEIRVGLFPGAGGTTRLTRKLGILNAAPFLLQGKALDPAKAKAAGLVDEVASDPVAAAREWVLDADNSDLVKPWDAKGYKMPGGPPYHPQGYMTFVGAPAMTLGRTKGAYPAAKALLSAVYEGALVDFDTALRIEARWFTSVMMHPSSEAMIRSLFLNKNALEKGAARPKGIADQRVRKVGVLGAGMMGAGIALVSAQAGLDVVLLDLDQEKSDRGKSHTANWLDKGVRRGKTTAEKQQATLVRITATPDLGHLANCDLIVEAVFEDPEVKAGMTRKAEKVIGSDCIFATNTSTLPISELARAASRPEKFIGIHFFSPVEKMQLVEIIKGRKTGDRAVAKALDYVAQIRKTPIVVNDSRFFYANRCIIPYLSEAHRMVIEGVTPVLIDHAAEQLGFPVGPIHLNDETSLDLAAKIARATKAALGDAYDDVTDELVFFMEGLGRLGRKAKAGFFEYDDNGKRTGYWHGLHDRFPKAASQPSLTEVQERLMFVQALEAIHALEENVLMDIREGDVGAILGWGFAPWSGGPFSWLDILGASNAVAKCEKLETRYGKRFACPELLRQLASEGQSFYGKFTAGSSG